MGTQISPNYAIIFTHNIETKFIYTSRSSPALYTRFLDDIFMIWTDIEQRLIAFMEDLSTVKLRVLSHRNYLLIRSGSRDVSLQRDDCVQETDRPHSTSTSTVATHVITGRLFLSCRHIDLEVFAAGTKTFDRTPGECGEFSSGNITRRPVLTTPYLGRQT